MAEQMRVHTLHPGDVVLGLRGDTLETLLGSCVSVILTDPRRTVAVMCHIVHARRNHGSGHHSAAHGREAFRAMDRLLIGQGIQPHLCDAYVYGGGNMFPDLYRQHHVGGTNQNWVCQELEARGHRICAHDLGGHMYRQVRWVVGEGEPQVRKQSV